MQITKLRNRVQYVCLVIRYNISIMCEDGITYTIFRHDANVAHNKTTYRGQGHT